MRLRLLREDLGAAAPDHHEPIEIVVFLEQADVFDDLFGQVALVAALLDVRTFEPLHVALVEHRGPRPDLFELGPDLLEQRRLEHAGGLRGGVAVLLEDVPAAEHDIVEAGQRHDLADLRRAPFGPLAETDRAHLGQRADRFGESFANGEDAGDGRGADGAEADEQDAEFSARGSDFNRCGHGQKLYHHRLMISFRRKNDPHMLAIGMTGVKMGDRIAQIGCAHGGRLGAIAAKVGLSGRAVAVVPIRRPSARARKGAADAGVLVDVDVAPPTRLPLEDKRVRSRRRGRHRRPPGHDASRGSRGGGSRGAAHPSPRRSRDGDRRRTRGGLGAIFTLAQSGPPFDPKPSLEADGFKFVRHLAEREGLRFVEGLKPREEVRDRRNATNARNFRSGSCALPPVRAPSPAFPCILPVSTVSTSGDGRRRSESSRRSSSRLGLTPERG